MVKKAVAVIAVVVLVFAAYWMAQSTIGVKEDTTTKTGVKGDTATTVAKSECIIWNKEDIRYVPMMKLCRSDEDCIGYGGLASDEVLSLAMPIYDFSKIKCAPTAFAPGQDREGRIVNCSSDSDCFRKSAMHEFELQGGVPSIVIENARPLFKCGEGVCKISTAMNNEVGSCLSEQDDYNECAYFATARGYLDE